MSSAVTILQSERLSYPGLLPREILILQSWLKLHEKEYDRFDYNIRVGQGTDPGDTYPDYIRKQAIQNTQKKVDAVGFSGSSVDLIEVKDRAGSAAIGQLLTYRSLWPASFPQTAVRQMILVTNVLNTDILSTLKELGIRLDLVEADFSRLRVRK